MKKTVVAIEDDPQIAELLEVLLASDELQIINYQNGKDGLAGVLKDKPDLVLLDIMLPNMNGWDVFDQIRADDEIKEMPIIILTVTQQNLDRRDTFTNSKINFYMTKPFDVLALRKKIDEVLQISEWRIAGTYPKRKPMTEPLKPISQRLFSEPPDTGTHPASTGNGSTPPTTDKNSKHDSDAPASQM